VNSRKAAPAGILANVSRDRLKELCRALGLDDSGREKTTLIVRVAAVARARRRKTPKPTDAGQMATASRRRCAAHGKLTREQLEGYLWSAADILRGSIDSSDYKNYILGLLFLKRLSDRFARSAKPWSRRRRSRGQRQPPVLRAQASPLV